jgi:hypothetical protein
MYYFFAVYEPENVNVRSRGMAAYVRWYIRDATRRSILVAEIVPSQTKYVITVSPQASDYVARDSTVVSV